MKIGVLSLQGGFSEHLKHLYKLGVEGIEIKKEKDLVGVGGIILPGGESTTIGKLLLDNKLLIPLRNLIESGLPAWGTCAGMILMAKSIENQKESYLEVMDIVVRRNAFGTQMDSFQVEDYIEEVSKYPIPLIFIRAPYIIKAGKDVKIIHKIKGNTVAVREKNMMATSFHPELSTDLEFHKYFLEICQENI